MIIFLATTEGKKQHYHQAKETSWLKGIDVYNSISIPVQLRSRVIHVRAST